MSIFKKTIFLPSTILCKKPFICSVFFEDLYNWREKFKIWIEENKGKYKNIFALLQLGWHYETPERMVTAKEQIRELHTIIPEIKLIFLCNSEIEANNFKSLGVQAHLCHQNAFLHESRYKITNAKKKYNAIYLARITPFKRYELASEIQHLLVIGSYSERETEYAQNILRNLSSDATWIKKVFGFYIYHYINQAKVGLALSAEEGGMYAATEYSLCGIPVLTTKNRGGRIYSLCPDYTHILQTDSPTPKDVVQGVDYLISKKFDSKDIRQTTVDVLNKHRACYKEIITSIFENTHQGNQSDFQHALHFPHKLGIRCRKFPLLRNYDTLKI